MNKTQTKETTPNTDTTEEIEITPLVVANAAHNAGLVKKEQVNAMELFTNGEMDYGTMRSLCG